MEKNAGRTAIIFCSTPEDIAVSGNLIAFLLNVLYDALNCIATFGNRAGFSATFHFFKPQNHYTNSPFWFPHTSLTTKWENLIKHQDNNCAQYDNYSSLEIIS